MAKKKAAPYPRELARGLLWSLTPPGYATLEEFIAAVRQYQIEIRGEDTWDAEAIILPAPRVRIRSGIDEAEDGAAMEVELTALTPAGFTSAELLFRVHNVFVARWREMAGDHTYFEGFSRVAATEGNPLYQIDLGS